VTNAVDLAGLTGIYRDLHAHPELAFAEHRTAGIVAARLRDLGYQTATGIGRTGVVGLLANGDGPTVLLRADMDALPVLERTGLDWASTERGVGAGSARTARRCRSCTPAAMTPTSPACSGRRPRSQPTPTAGAVGWCWSSSRPKRPARARRP
jgi:hypothetical protein